MRLIFKSMPIGLMLLFFVASGPEHAHGSPYSCSYIVWNALQSSYEKFQKVYEQKRIEDYLKTIQTTFNSTNFKTCPANPELNNPSLGMLKLYANDLENLVKMIQTQSPAEWPESHRFLLQEAQWISVYLASQPEITPSLINLSLGEVLGHLFKQKIIAFDRNPYLYHAYILSQTTPPLRKILFLTEGLILRPSSSDLIIEKTIQLIRQHLEVTSNVNPNEEWRWTGIEGLIQKYEGTKQSTDLVTAMQELNHRSEDYLNLTEPQIANPTIIKELEIVMRKTENTTARRSKKHRILQK